MRNSKKWLDALSEHQTELRTISACLSLCDLKNDNDHKLVCAEIPKILDGKSRLKVYKGTTLISDQGLPSLPSAVASFYIDESDFKIPIICVSVGSSILFYRNMKPYYKFTLPSMPVEAHEQDIWRRLPIEKPEKVETLIADLKTIEFGLLTPQSQKLIHLQEEDRQSHINAYADAELQRLSCVTAICTLSKSTNSDKAPSCLVVAAESGDLYILDTLTFAVLQQAKVCAIESAPTLLSASGQYDIDYRIVIACRDGGVSILRKTWLEGRQIFKLNFPASGLALLPIDQTIVIVCMNKNLDCYSKKGRKLWAIDLPAAAVCMIPVVLPHSGQSLVCVALRGGLVQLYLKRVCVDQFMMNDTVSAMIFGRLGQEEHVLVLVTMSGSLIVKILKRTAQFNGDDEDINKNNASANTADRSLQIPKKTKIFVEQTVRERESADGIYHSFQSELWRMRLTAARETVEVINTAESAFSSDSKQAPIKLAAEVVGLGPVFRLILFLENMAVSRKEAPYLFVVLHADHRHYLFDTNCIRLPPLVPGAALKIDFEVTVVTDANDGLPVVDLNENGTIRVMVVRSGMAKPIIAATVAMPAPEPTQLDLY